MSSDRWLTYADAAALLGVQVDSLRHRARREHWGKRMSNEGKAMVLVPLDSVPQPGDPAGDPTGDTPGSPPPSRPARQQEDQVAHHLAHIADLERRIIELRADLDTSRQDVERERGERQTERDRADRVTSELAEIARAFAVTTATATAEGRARETALEAKLEAARAEMKALHDRPWWARLMQAARG